MVSYYSLNEVYTIVTSGMPAYHHAMLFGHQDPLMKDRSREKNEVRNDFKSSTGRSSFFYQASRLWNQVLFKNDETLETFKKKSKAWVIAHVPIKP